MNDRCRVTLESISAYLDGELDTSVCDSIEQHCEDCRSCAAIVTGLRKSIGLCRQLGTAPLPKPILDRARASIRQLLDET
jgi:anti-sigma factor RsiW